MILSIKFLKLFKIFGKFFLKNWIYFFLFFTLIIPWYYTVTASLPAKDQLYKQVGTFDYKKLSARTGYVIGITHDGKTQYFTCRLPMGRRNDCLAPREFNLLELYKGKPAEVLWFKQKEGFGSKSQRLARLEVNEKELVSLKKTERLIKGSHTDANFALGIVLVLGILLELGFKQIERKKKENDK
ncbi:hypothetical protein [Acinetobacter brisouii]